MKIAQTYSHFNGLEFLKFRKPDVWLELQHAIADTDAARCIENEAKAGKNYSPLELRTAISNKLVELSWNEIALNLNKSNFNLDEPNLLKERVAVELHLKSDALEQNELYMKHLAFYVGDKIDLGIEILPMKSLQSQMSSGPSYFEGELYNVIRQGRGVPAVPLVIIGIEP